MKEREELRGGKRVTVVEREPHELSPEQRIAALEARVTAQEAEIAELKKLLTPPAK